jgi:hypothetical protein
MDNEEPIAQPARTEKSSPIRQLEAIDVEELNVDLPNIDIDPWLMRPAETEKAPPSWLS